MTGYERRTVPTYRPRVIDTELRASLDASGAVLIEGPRACGKTETARQVAASEARLDIDSNTSNLAAIDPSLVLEGPTPRLIDEWQTVPRSGTMCGAPWTIGARRASSS